MQNEETVKGTLGNFESFKNVMRREKRNLMQVLGIKDIETLSWKFRNLINKSGV